MGHELSVADLIRARYRGSEQTVDDTPQLTRDPSCTSP